MATFITPLLEGREPYDLYKWAVDLFEGREYLPAIEVLEHLLTQVSRSEAGEARELLVRSYFHSAQLAKAAEAAEALLIDNPTNGYAALLRFRSLERAGWHDEAQTAKRVAEALGMDTSGR
ncbi:MAG TPA: hypothetical protein PLX71_02770 [Phycicoccus sp.]|nr:hypothetical protein [Phycicoccus sp.]